MAIKSIIFDLDGTLIDSSKGIVEAFNYALKKMNLGNRPAESITPYIGYPLEEMFKSVTNHSTDELKEHFRDKAVETVVASTVALDGAEQTIVSLFEKGYQLGIATTKIRQHIDGIVEKLAWQNYFHAVIGGDEVSRVKPEPDQFLSLLEKMQTEPKEALAVGDTVNDVIAARRSAIPIVGVSSPYGRADEVRDLNPDYFVERIEELTKVIKSIDSTGAAGG